MPSVSVLDGAGAPQTIQTLPAVGQAVMAASLPVAIASNQSAIPVSATALPLPTGAATSAKQPALGTAGSASIDVLTIQGIASMTALKVDGSAVTQPVSGTFWQATQPVSIAGTLNTTESRLPTALGATTSALSLAVTLATDQPTIATYTPGGFVVLSQSITRPADANVYAAGDLVADSTTAATVIKIQNLARTTGEAARIERIRLRKTSTSLTNASFRINLFRTAPTLTVNDNGVFNASNVLAVSDIAGFIGYVDITMDRAGVTGAAGRGVPSLGASITLDGAGTGGDLGSVWAVIEALGAYTPASGETFTLTLEAARS